MKNTLFSCVICSLIGVLNLIPAKGQSRPDGSTPQFLYRYFADGVVRTKDNRSQKIVLNYNTVSEKMVYFQDGKVYDIVVAGTIDTVYIGNNRFVPSGKGFYEVLVGGSMPLLVQYKGKVIPAGAPAAYGGTSQVSSSHYAKTVEVSTGQYNLEMPPDYNIEVEVIYWIKKDDNMLSFMGERQFLKLFADHESDIKKFIKKNKIKFDNKIDMIKLVKYCKDLILK